jgi:hypothetical protein
MAAQPQPIIIHNHIGDNGNNPLNPIAVNAPAAPPHPAIAIMGKERLTLDEFCARFDLSPEIHDKARELKISGAHGFYLVSEQALTRKFDPGEVADIEMAKQRWFAGL